MKKLITTIMMLFLTINLFAAGNELDMGDVFYSNGRIYVVVLCVAVILIGLFLFLFSMDRRLKKIEKKSTSKN